MDFYHLVQDLEEMLEEAGLNSTFQLVAFHPGFVFEGGEANGRANLLNRSPFPTLHILRFSDIEDLNLSKAEAREISLRNERKLNELDESSLRSLFPGRFD